MHKFQEHKGNGNTFRKLDDSPGIELVFCDRAAETAINVRKAQAAKGLF